MGAPRPIEKLRLTSGMRYLAVMTSFDPTNSVLAAEPLIRLSVFAAALALLMVWEFLASRRHLTVGRR